MIDVLEVLEDLEDVAQDVLDHRLALERLERDRAVEDDVLGQDGEGGVDVAGLDAGPEVVGCAHGVSNPSWRDCARRRPSALQISPSSSKNPAWAKRDRKTTSAGQSTCSPGARKCTVRSTVGAPTGCARRTNG